MLLVSCCCCCCCCKTLTGNKSTSTLPQPWVRIVFVVHVHVGVCARMLAFGVNRRWDWEEVVGWASEHLTHVSPLFKTLYWTSFPAPSSRLTSVASLLHLCPLPPLRAIVNHVPQTGGNHQLAPSHWGTNIDSRRDMCHNNCTSMLNRKKREHN